MARNTNKRLEEMKQYLYRAEHIKIKPNQLLVPDMRLGKDDMFTQYTLADEGQTIEVVTSALITSTGRKSEITEPGIYTVSAKRKAIRVAR